MNAGVRIRSLLRHFLLITFLSHSGSTMLRAGGLDSIGGSFFKQPRFIGGFATKTTFISGFHSPIFTGRIGIEYDRRLRIGAGASWLKLTGYRNGKDNSPFYLDQTFVDSSGSYTIHPFLQFQYLHIFFEYIYYQDEKWVFSTPLQLGVGYSFYQYNFNGENRIIDRDIIALYEPAVSGQYKITSWFGVGLDVGVRLMFLTNKNIGNRFTSPVYDVKALIYWAEIFKKAKSKK